MNDAEEITRTYNNGLIIVDWRAGLCERCEICKTELPTVFDPMARPWVNLNGASNEQIVDTVSRCPTQALSIRKEA